MVAIFSWGRWVNSLWPSDAIWQKGSRSTLVQTMACCLTAPSQYLNQCWLIIKNDQWCSSEGNFAWDVIAISHQITLKIIFLRLYWNLPGANELIDPRPAVGLGGCTPTEPMWSVFPERTQTSRPVYNLLCHMDPPLLSNSHTNDGKFDA